LQEKKTLELQKKLDGFNNNSKSKYIAYFERWLLDRSFETSKQVDCLGQNEECNIVWTKFNKINAGDLLEIDMPQFEKIRKCYNWKFFLKLQGMVINMYVQNKGYRERWFFKI
jgi:hypothetical protein